MYSLSLEKNELWGKVKRPRRWDCSKLRLFKIETAQNLISRLSISQLVDPCDIFIIYIRLETFNIWKIKSCHHKEWLTLKNRSFERRICAQTQDLDIFKKFNISQMNPNEVFHNTAYSVQLPYIAGNSL